MSNSHLSGRCLCGAISFTATAKDVHADVCHCTMCRRWTGGPAPGVMLAEPATVTGEEHLATYKSSEWGIRQFCAICGSSLFWAAPAYGYFGVTAGTLDDTSALTLTKEIFIDHKPALYTFADPTDKLTEAEFLAQFADSSATQAGDDHG
ncbi:MAG: GFA family protein [Hyphomicrobiaceae bacterium]